jgi:hypothetical protein
MDNSQIKSLPFVKLSLTLTAEALGFLAGTTNGVSHFALYHALLVNMSAGYQTITKRGINIRMRPYQADASVNALSAKFGLGRKVITRLLTTMCQLGIINLTFSKLITIADMLDAFAYKEDGLSQDSLKKALADDITDFTDILATEGGADKSVEECLRPQDESGYTDKAANHAVLRRNPEENEDFTPKSELPY